jgi:uncharacterized damage-inducible protein DinB
MSAHSILARLLEHNNWANRRIIRACSALSDNHLDAKPQSAEHWSIRENLMHLVECQQAYLSLLTAPPEARGDATLSFAELEESADSSGEGLLALALAWSDGSVLLQTTDGYGIERWVVMVQAVNHATEHRKQIAHLMRLLGLDPPRLDGWAFGEAAQAVTPIPK